MDQLRRLQYENARDGDRTPMGTGGIPGARAFEGVLMCSGCPHIPHEPGLCGGHSLITVARCACTYNRTQTYVRAAR